MKKFISTNERGDIMDPWEEPKRFEISSDTFQAITPNRKLFTEAMSQILVGIGMTFLVIPFFRLETILPLVGGCLMLMGFRTLRRSDVWFERCFIVAAIHLFFILCSIVLNSTIYRSMIGDSIISFTLVLIFPLTTIVLLYYLWKGFLSACKEVGVIFDCSVVLFLLVWYLVLVFLIIIQHYGLLIFIIMAVLLVYLLRRSFDLAWAIRAAKYTVTPVEYKISNVMWIAAVGVLLVTAIGISYLFFQKYPMKWELRSVEHSSDMEAIKDHLIQLGFPRELLDDLTKEDIQGCIGATHVLIETEVDSSSKSEDLQLTTVAVKTFEELGYWKVFHHFLWTKNPEFCGTEAFYRFMKEDEDGWHLNQDFTGRVLYDDAGNTYSSPYYALQKKSAELELVPGNPWYRSYLIATFSFPTKARRARGYFSYVIKEEIEATEATSETNKEGMWHIFHGYTETTGMMLETNYVHQVSKKRYPVITAEEKITKVLWLGGDGFDLYGSTFYLSSKKK